MPFPTICAEAIVNNFSLEWRLELTKSIPYLKELSLTLNSVEFGENQVEINGTVHKLGVYRQYPEGQPIPREHQQDNERGGFSKDLDSNGAIVRNSKLLDGDVQLIPRNMWVEGSSLSTETNPPFKRLLQYTIKEPNGTTTIKRFEYNRPLHEAFKSLNTKMFGGYAFSIIVKDFSIKWGLHVIPLPVGVTFTVQNLTIGSSTYLGSPSLREMLTKNKKIRVLDVDYGRGNDGFRDDFSLFETCHTALFRDFQADRADRLEKITNMKNHEIVIASPARRFTNQFIEIIRTRIRNCPPTGQKFTVEFYDVPSVQYLLQNIETEFQDRPAVNCPLLLEIDNQPNLQLEVSYTSEAWGGWRRRERVVIEAKRKSFKRKLV